MTFDPYPCRVVAMGPRPNGQNLPPAKQDVIARGDTVNLRPETRRPHWERTWEPHGTTDVGSFLICFWSTH